MHAEQKARPFIKWAGGKGQLLSQMDDYLPMRLSNEPFTYVEPFVGGGAMLFHILQKFPNIKKVIINDINVNLAKAYHTIKDNPEALIDELGRMENKYLPLNYEQRKNMFLEKRAKFNRHSSNDIENTALLMFLNKTCFNGLYRVNRNDDFNVPFGKYKNPIICNASIIAADSHALNRVETEITCGDFTKTTDFIDPKGLNFFYFDPPYRPLTETSSFTSYTKDCFNDDDQRRLAKTCREITAANCLWMQSNSDGSTKEKPDAFFDDLYKDFCIERVYASRSINSNPAKRGKLTELLIHSNYKTAKQLLFKTV